MLFIVGDCARGGLHTHELTKNRNWRTTGTGVNNAADYLKDKEQGKHRREGWEVKLRGSQAAVKGRAERTLINHWLITLHLILSFFIFDIDFSILLHFGAKRYD